MRGILGQTLKDNRVLKKGIVTGITRIAQESLFSGVNNVIVYSLLKEPYAEKPEIDSGFSRLNSG